MLASIELMNYNKISQISTHSTSSNLMKYPLKRILTH